MFNAGYTWGKCTPQNYQRSCSSLKTPEAMKVVEIAPHLFLYQHLTALIVPYRRHFVSRALPWVDEPLLAEAHKRLPPRDLYFPVESKASREGRWQEFAAEALEECGYAYFLPAEELPADKQRGDGSNAVVNHGNLDDDLHPTSNDRGAECRINASVPGNRRSRITSSLVGTTGSKPRASRRSRIPAGSTPEAVAACRAALKRQVIEQSNGLHLELRRAVRAARTTFKKGERVESRWRRPSRLDKPRVDPHAWHPGRATAVANNSKLTIRLEDGEGEHLSGIPSKHVRFAPGPIPRSSLMSDRRSTSGTEPKPSNLKLGAKSMRKLAHVASTIESLRTAWEYPLTINQELTRLRRLLEESVSCRPAWRGSFPDVSFQKVKRAPINGEATPETWGGPQHRRQHARHIGRRKTTRSLRTTGVVPGSHNLVIVTSSAKRPLPDDYEMHVNTSLPLPRPSGLKSARMVSVSPALPKTQYNLVAAALAYESCVSTVKECLERGVFSFHAARTYSEQQNAFDETTANLGPTLKARTGYMDWRGRNITGIQNATLDVVEALDAWTTEQASSADQTVAEMDERGSGPDAGKVNTCPFLWEGSPLVAKIIGFSATLFENALELKKWYGPGFPVARNPFFLAYPIDERPVTPRSALVRTNANGEVRGSRRAAIPCIELL